MDVIETLTQRERMAVRYALSLLHGDEYFRRYYALLDGDTTPAGAGWRELEREVLELTGRHRYTDYETFRQMRHRYCRRIQIRRGNP